MVAYKAAQTASFIRKPDPRFGAALVYGPESSLVAERVRELARSISKREDTPAQITRIDDRELAENPDRLAIELQTESMFAERCIVIVRAERRLRPDDLKELIEADLTGVLIVEAGNLRPNSPLRKLFEGSDRAVALPCYADAGRELGPLIDHELAGAGVTLARDARPALMSRLGSDLGMARSELIKLVTYAGKGGEIGIEEIEAVIGDMGSGVADALASAAADGNLKSALRQFDALIAAGQSAHSVLAALTRHFQRLHRLCAATEAGEPANNTIAKFRPPLHFKQRDALLGQVRKWSGERAAKALQAIHETMKATRLSPDLEAELTQRLLLQISR